ncbi:prepilin-type cleavage/methylation domain-containing protein [cyanobacterium TDX16]|nr:prepilin-type cleavage/methylation domain-containing protein [cyanobacterium TDX16]
MHLNKLPLQDKGFTLFEVLISILIVSVFLTVAMQALLFAIIFKVRAEQRNEAATWIQKDLEFVKNQAKEYEKNTFPYSIKCIATTSNDGFAASFLNSIGGTPTTDGPRVLGGKNFVLNRTADYATSSDPFKLLKLEYSVSPQDGGSAIATLSTEVIPDASLKCP